VISALILVWIKFRTDDVAVVSEKYKKEGKISFKNNRPKGANKNPWHNYDDFALEYLEQDDSLMNEYKRLQREVEELSDAVEAVEDMKNRTWHKYALENLSAAEKKFEKFLDTQHVILYGEHYDKYDQGYRNKNESKQRKLVLEHKGKPIIKSGKKITDVPIIKKPIKHKPLQAANLDTAYVRKVIDPYAKGQKYCKYGSACPDQVGEKSSSSSSKDVEGCKRQHWYTVRGDICPFAGNCKVSTCKLVHVCTSFFKLESKTTQPIICDKWQDPIYDLKFVSNVGVQHEGGACRIGNRMFTAGHLVQGQGVVTLTYNKVDVYTGSLVWTDHGDDLVSVAVSDLKSFNPVGAAARWAPMPIALMPIYLLHGRGGNVATGFLAGALHEQSMGFVSHTASTEVGDCGYPIMDGKGHVVGLHVQGGPGDGVKTLNWCTRSTMSKNL
jgi:hypothetical protein